MNIWEILIILTIVSMIIGLFVGYKFKDWGNIEGQTWTHCFCCLIAIFSLCSIHQRQSTNNEVELYRKMKEQIIYEIEIIDNDANKQKLNEQILEYNCWVYKVKQDKEQYGWLSKYNYLDISEYSLIIYV